MSSLDIVAAVANLARPVLVQLALAAVKAHRTEGTERPVLSSPWKASASMRHWGTYIRGCTDHRSIYCVSMDSTKRYQH